MSKQSLKAKGRRDFYSLSLKKFEEFIFYSLIFLLPSQLAYHFWPDYSFIFGIRVDYLAPTIYLTDLLIILLVSISRTKVKTIYLFGFCIFALVNTLASVSPAVSFWKWLKILELTYFAKYIYGNKKLLQTKIFAKVLSMSLILVSIVGIGQFLLGRTLGFTFLGERTFSISTPGIALQNFFDKEHLRAYSFFSHPNSLAGYLFVLVIIFFRKLKPLWLTVLISFTAFLLTFSLSAFSGALFGLPILFTGFDLNAPEISERVQLINISKEVVAKNFLIGQGLGTFPLINSLMQPVHNIFLLALSETGVVGFGALCFLFFKLLKRNWYIFIFVLITGLLDHYWLTLQQNMILFSLVYGYLF